MKSIQRARMRAEKSQNNCCYYCGKPMATDEDHLDIFAKKNNLSKKLAKQLLATGEHLKPRCEGGTCAQDNIVAAHAICNRRRHQRKNAPSPEQYRNFVQRRCVNGGWHAPAVLRMPSHLPPLRT